MIFLNKFGMILETKISKLPPVKNYLRFSWQQSGKAARPDQRLKSGTAKDYKFDMILETKISNLSAAKNY